MKGVSLIIFSKSVLTFQIHHVSCFVINTYSCNTFETAYLFLIWDTWFLYLSKVLSAMLWFFSYFSLSKMVISNFSESFIEALKTVIRIILIFVKNLTPTDFIKIFFQFIHITIFKISFLYVLDVNGDKRFIKNLSE